MMRVIFSAAPIFSLSTFSFLLSPFPGKSCQYGQIIKSQTFSPQRLYRISSLPIHKYTEHRRGMNIYVLQIDYYLGLKTIIKHSFFEDINKYQRRCEAACSCSTTTTAAKSLLLSLIEDKVSWILRPQQQHHHQ